MKNQITLFHKNSGTFYCAKQNSVKFRTQYNSIEIQKLDE